MNVLETIDNIATQVALYGDEGEWDIDFPDNLDELWEAWAQAQRYAYAARQLKAFIAIEMEKHVPDGAEVRLGDDLWRYSAGGRWEAADAPTLIADLLGVLEPSELPQRLASLFSGFRVTALDAIAERIGVDPDEMRRDYARYKSGTDERKLAPIPISRAPKRAAGYEHGEVHP